MTQARTRVALWSFLFGNMVIGTGIMLPAGLLSVFMADLGLSAPTAGHLSLVGGLVVGVGAPLVAAMTYRVDRRVLLTLALGFYVVGHAGAVLSADFGMVLAFRALTVAGAAIFTPQAAATVGLLTGPERRGAGIAFIFIGWSLAAVLGIPLGTLLGDWFGWRGTYLCMAGFAAVGAIAVWLSLPAGLVVARLTPSAWVKVLLDVRLMLVLSVTLLVGAGQTTVFVYLTPVMREVYGLAAEEMALTFLISGACGVLGNVAVARMSAHISGATGAMVSMGLVLTAMAIIAWTWGQYPAFLAAVCLWQIGGFAVNSFQQGRLVALAPALASATVALNTSAVYLGQATGARTGGVLMREAVSPSLALAAMALVICGMAASVLADRLAGGR